jgi:hypothetical protein
VKSFPPFRKTPVWQGLSRWQPPCKTQPVKGASVIHIRVQYDAQTRTFKLVDEQSNTFLEGDALYDLAIPFTVEEVEKGKADDAFSQFFAAAVDTANSSRN